VKELVQFERDKADIEREWARGRADADQKFLLGQLLDNQKRRDDESNKIVDQMISGQDSHRVTQQLADNSHRAATGGQIYWTIIFSVLMGGLVLVLIFGNVHITL
jgi:hypothetical protein